MIACDGAERDGFLVLGVGDADAEAFVERGGGGGDGDSAFCAQQGFVDQVGVFEAEAGGPVDALGLGVLGVEGVGHDGGDGFAGVVDVGEGGERCAEGWGVARGVEGDAEAVAGGDAEADGEGRGVVEFEAGGVGVVLEVGDVGVGDDAAGG